jgi:hypothetical protein
MGMHPTAFSMAFILTHPARRVMPGVRTDWKRRPDDAGVSCRRSESV